MMAKDSVKKRFNGEGDGMSFTEFTYQLVQGYDFLHLYETDRLQSAARRRRPVGQHHHRHGADPPQAARRPRPSRITCPLITKADGTKFGKTESGNVWLDPRYTSPYKFYQFWLNVSDDDAKRYIKIFTLLDRQTIDDARSPNTTQPPTCAYCRSGWPQEITVMIHSQRGVRKGGRGIEHPLRRRYLRGACANSTNRPCCRFSKECRSTTSPVRN